MPRQIFVGQPYSLSWSHGWHMSRLLRETSHNAAHNIELSLVGDSHFYSLNNVGTPHAFPSINPGNNRGVFYKIPYIQ